MPENEQLFRKTIIIYIISEFNCLAFNLIPAYQKLISAIMALNLVSKIKETIVLLKRTLN